MLNVIMLIVIMLIVVMLIVVMLNVVMLSVVAPFTLVYWQNRLARTKKHHSITNTTY